VGQKESGVEALLDGTGECFLVELSDDGLAVVIVPVFSGIMAASTHPAL
jgi:hypothetical protein